MRKLTLVLLTLWPFSLGLAAPEGGSDVVVSFTEDMADPQAATDEKDLRRFVAFVEFIHRPRLEACQKKGFKDCPQFEFSAPILPEGLGLDYEKVLVREWLRLVVRTSLRLQLDAGALLPAVACTAGWFDLTWYLYTGDVLFPASDFCSGYGLANILPNCFFECDIPLDGTCPMPNSGCIKCIAQRYADTGKTLYTDYYPEYLKNGLAALAKAMPTGLMWGDVNKLDFSFLQPLGSLDLNFLGIADLAKAAQSKDLRGAAYMTQSGAYSRVCQPSVALLSDAGAKLLDLLKTLPGEGLDVRSPGLKQLEELKRSLADRESAGDSATRLLRAITRMDGTELNPKYIRDKGNDLLGLGDYPQSRRGTTLPSQYACLGYVTVFKVFPETETQTIGGGLRPAACWGLPPVTVVPILPAVLVAPRLHTDWVAVPEGYDVPGVRGLPAY